MFPYCPTGSKFNLMRAKIRQMANEPDHLYRDRLRRKMLFLESREGWGCVSEYDSCAHCPRGKTAFIDALWGQFPYWLRPDLEALVTSLTQDGPGRRLPNWCDIGHQINQVLTSGSVTAENAGDVARVLASENRCLDMPSCAHCALGQGGFEDLLLQLSEHGMTSELREQLNPW